MTTNKGITASLATFINVIAFLIRATFAAEGLTKMSTSSIQNKRQRKEVEIVSFRIVNVHCEELDDSAVNSPHGRYSRCHLAVNEGGFIQERMGGSIRLTNQNEYRKPITHTCFRLAQIDGNPHHNKGISIDPRSYYQIDGIYELTPTAQSKGYRDIQTQLQAWHPLLSR